MKYKVVLECLVEEAHVEDALQETMMIARSLCEHPDVWPESRTENWQLANSSDPLYCSPSLLKCEVTQV